MSLELADLQKSKNIAELLEEKDLIEIGYRVVKGYEIDEESRQEWKQTIDDAMEIAKQIMKRKSFPWDNASNIKFPLIARACIDYASRTMPEIIQNDRVVRAVVIGKDDQGLKYEKANRVSQFMSYQLMEMSMGWEDETDKLIQVLPVLGTVFKKTYFDPIENYNCSELCLPDKIVVNYHTPCLEKARRITHCITLYANDVIERQKAGIFCDEDDYDIEKIKDVDANHLDVDAPREFLEQHCWLDLDEDGYQEPYIVTVHKDSKKVFRIVNRFDKIEKNKSGEIKRIEAEQYFIDFHFIRSPDAGFYSMGFGSLLLPINKSINTLINQLIDSGTLNNMQGGLIGRGLRIKNGQIRFKMGEWQVLDAAAGDDLKKNIFPWPTKEPSETLFKLLSLMMQVGNDLSASTDISKGKQQAQNVSSGTISQLVEQGTKVFVAINKRLYRSLKKEFKKLFFLNSKYLKQAKYAAVLGDSKANVKKDFDEKSFDIFPVADPVISTETQRIARAGTLQALKTVDPREADRVFLESLQLDVDVIDKLLPEKNPNDPPPPEVQKLMAEVQLLQAQVAKMSADATLEAERNAIAKVKLQQENQESDSRINESVARSWKMQQDAMDNLNKLAIVKSKMVSEQNLKAADLSHKVDVDQAQTLIKAHEVASKNNNEQVDTVLKAHQINLDTLLKNKKLEQDGESNNESGNSTS